MWKSSHRRTRRNDGQFRPPRNPPPCTPGPERQPRRVGLSEWPQGLGSTFDDDCWQGRRVHVSCVPGGLEGDSAAARRRASPPCLGQGPDNLDRRSSAGPGRVARGIYPSWAFATKPPSAAAPRFSRHEALHRSQRQDTTVSGPLILVSIFTPWSPHSGQRADVRRSGWNGFVVVIVCIHCLHW